MATPKTGASGPETAPRPLPGLLLAAGFSRRMGVCKLALPWRGATLVEHAARAARAAGLSPLLLVTRPDADPALRAALERECAAPGTEQVVAELAVKGQAESLKAGVRRLLELENAGTPVAGVAVLLGDQPLIRPETIRRLTALFLQDPTRPVAPVFAGKRGHPVLLPRGSFEAVLTLSGDTGPRALLSALGLVTMPVEDSSILADIDTRDAYEYLLKMKTH